LPKLFLERLRKIIPPHKFDQVANTFTERKPTTCRINIIKASRDPIREKLEREDFRLKQVSWYRDAFILCGGRQRELEKTKVYLDGGIYVQSLSSMIPPLALFSGTSSVTGQVFIGTSGSETCPGQNWYRKETVLDLTAAPGSKTTQMACLMDGKGEIVAIENDRIRFEKLRANLELQKAANVKPLLGNGEVIGRKCPAYFDRILLDAPCSAEGRFNTSAPSSHRYWALQKIEKIAKLQKKLLFSALSALKPGGVLVYSTCTFAPEENEGVVDEVLRYFKESIEFESIRLAIPNQMPGLTAWEGKKFHPCLKRALRIVPTSEMEGFFIARIRKVATRS
ncbi:MAG: RsmB/NOP family class I SAM-dependent RNA methyltransferase, partial [Candidatus Omnitrophica bacterium]|nr:RsmB/NOP family class I SAM-dependent RNA methyltransferase [Candidatus Omnitrophota bacterium]